MQIKGGATRRKQATGQACAVSDISSARRAGQRYYKRFLCPTHEKISSPWSCSQLLTRGFFAAAAAEVAAAAPPGSMPFRLFLPASSASSSFSMRRTYAHITGHGGQHRSEIRALAHSGTHTLHKHSNLVMPTQSEGEIKRRGKETKRREKQQSERKHTEAKIHTSWSNTNGIGTNLSPRSLQLELIPNMYDGICASSCFEV